DGREPLPADDDRVLPDHRSAGSNLAHRDHSSGNGAPDLQAVDGTDVVALGQWRPRNDRQKTCFLRVDSCAGAAGLTIEANGTAFEAGFQVMCHLYAGNAVAPWLQLE